MQEHQLHVNGVDLALFEWGDPSAPPILFVHATGFHARLWDQVIARLPELHCYAVDMRGHGRSSKPAPPYDWRSFGADVAALGQALGLSGAIGVGHSMGGHSVTLAAAQQPALFARLLLIDPVILPRQFYIGVLPDEHFAARRRVEWRSPDEMIERFKDRPPFNRWKPEILRDYAVYGLLPKPDGDGYVLACPPAVEADIYRHGSAADIYPEIATVRLPVTVLRAGGQREPNVFDFSTSPTAPDLAAQFPHGTDVPLPQFSHFIPMEAPELVADYVRQLAQTP